jgi:tripartite-type tricarboxylate transporter receptor subunit TctC
MPQKRHEREETSMRLRKGLCAGALVVLLAQCVAGPGRTEDDFYKGKTINFIIGTAPGGGYDSYSRLIARHIGKHLPGQPSVVPQNMPGAAGIRAANYLSSVAPKDGTVIGMLDQAVYLDQILGTAGLSVDATKFNWIGRILSNSAVLYVWHTAQVKTIEDVFTYELFVSTSGAASRLNWTVLNNVLGMKFRIIPGYQGSNDSRLAMMRGEVDALSQPWPVLKVEGEQLLRDKQINLLLQTGADKHPELAHVPRMIDLAKNADDKTLLGLFSSPSTIGRSVVAPPDVPPERIRQLRQAFMTAIHDTALLDEVKRLKLELDPLDGEALQSVIAGGGAIAPELIARARRVAEK